MNNPLLHQHENSQDTETFLKENGERFSNDCIMAMQLMYKGVKLNGETCKELYGFSDRRLRDCIAGRPDIVKKAWKRNEQGKRLYVEYWIDVPKPITKAEVQKFWNDYQKEGAPIRFIQPNLF